MFDCFVETYAVDTNTRAFAHTGGIADGRGLAMGLSLGASAAWVGTRFICAEEAGAPPRHQKVWCCAG